VVVFSEAEKTNPTLAIINIEKMGGAVGMVIFRYFILVISA